ncbi:MAG: HD domain-containing protein [Spirochaetia bacterium]
MNRTVVYHLQEEYTQPVRDPLWKHIYLSPGMVQLLNTPSFRMLHRIKQLGIIYTVYPGATHTRFSHSLGVFHTAKRMIGALLNHELPVKITLEGVKAFLCAALLHDTGHFPFTHSLKELPLLSHETLTGHLVTSSPIAGILSDGVGTSPDAVAAIVDTEIDTVDEEIIFYRNLLSGVLDPDKLDYLTRDAYFCGIPYGIQDIDYVLSRILPHRTRGLSLRESGITAVENILFSKYLMFRSVYWHRTVRAATAMIKKALYLGLSDGVIGADDLYSLDDGSFYRELMKKKYDPFCLLERTDERDFYKVVYDTSWQQNDEYHQKLTSLDYRTSAEKQIAAAVGADPLSVIIDIPEPINLEIDLPVVGEDTEQAFPESPTVFTRRAVADFKKILRRVRLLLPDNLACKTGDPEQLFLTGKL